MLRITPMPFGERWPDYDTGRPAQPTETASKATALTATVTMTTTAAVETLTAAAEWIERAGADDLFRSAAAGAAVAITREPRRLLSQRSRAGRRRIGSCIAGRSGDGTPVSYSACPRRRRPGRRRGRLSVRVERDTGRNLSGRVRLVPWPRLASVRRVGRTMTRRCLMLCPCFHSPEGTPYGELTLPTPYSAYTRRAPIAVVEGSGRACLALHLSAGAPESRSPMRLAGGPGPLFLGQLPSTPPVAACIPAIERCCNVGSWHYSLREEIKRNQKQHENTSRTLSLSISPSSFALSHTAAHLAAARQRPMAALPLTNRWQLGCWVIARTPESALSRLSRLSRRQRPRARCSRCFSRQHLSAAM